MKRGCDTCDSLKWDTTRDCHKKRNSELRPFCKETGRQIFHVAHEGGRPKWCPKSGRTYIRNKVGG